MKRTLTPRVMILAASIAGLIACNASKKVEEQQQDLAETRQEVAKDQADLRNDQMKESANLQQEQLREQQRDGVGAPTVNRTGEPIARTDTMGHRDTNDIRENQNERAEDRTDLAKEHAEERAELNKDSAEKLQAKKEDVAEAKQDANEQRADLVKDSREKLRDLDERADKIRTKIGTGEAEEPKERTQVTTALSTYPTQRQAAERDIEALNSVSEANLNRAKKQVDKQLSSLDKVLDRAESAL